MSNTKKDNRRKTTPSFKYGERKYFLVQFIEDNVKLVVDETDLRKEDNTTSALYLDKKFYPCVVLSESDDKEKLIKSKAVMENITKKRSGSSLKETKQSKKTKAKPPVTKVAPKAKSQHEKNEAEKEREEKKKEKQQKKKALDERDFNVLSQLSQLNRSVIVMDECDRSVEEKERELARRQADLDRREKEVERKVRGHAQDINEVKKKNEMKTRDMLEIARPSLRIDVEEDNEDSDEYTELDDGGFLDYSDNIDVLEASSIIKTPERASVGMKRPRENPLAIGTTAKKCPRRQALQPECAQCCHLLAENKELREANALLTEQLNAQKLPDKLADKAPRPGKISKEVAERYKMIELSPGRCVYIYESHLTKACSKKTATSTACFLLSCFYTDDELIGKSLGGKNGKECVDTDILESILSYTRKKFPAMTSDSPVKIALRNKITCLEAKFKKRTVQVIG